MPGGGAAAPIEVAAVRPYSRRIRERVFGALARLGLAATTLVEPGASDDEALDALKRCRARLLLVPFHAHRDVGGGVVNGLDLIARLRAEVPAHRDTPILCPVSSVGMAAAGLMASRGDPLEAVLLLEEDRFESREALRTVRRFLEAHGLSG